jgi:hypothetical protein
VTVHMCALIEKAQHHAQIYSISYVASSTASKTNVGAQ